MGGRSEAWRSWFSYITWHDGQEACKTRCSASKSLQAKAQALISSMTCNGNSNEHHRACPDIGVISVIFGAAAACAYRGRSPSSKLARPAILINGPVAYFNCPAGSRSPDRRSTHSGISASYSITIGMLVIYLRAWPLVAGTLITLGTGLGVGVPVANDPQRSTLLNWLHQNARTFGPITLTCWRRVPSVVYGLWGVFILYQTLNQQALWFCSYLLLLPGWAVLAVLVWRFNSRNYDYPHRFRGEMREVLATVPTPEKRGCARDCDQVEMIRYYRPPTRRSGITSAAMLGLGRAIGEPLPSRLVIGSARPSAIIF